MDERLTVLYPARDCYIWRYSRKKCFYKFIGKRGDVQGVRMMPRRYKEGKDMMICIGREFGSGGYEIGKRLAEKSGIPFYDRQLVEMAIRRCETISEELEKADEKKVNGFLYRNWYEETADKNLWGLSANDILFKLQSEVITELSQSGDAVFIGRCADYILDRAKIPRISVFISAPFSDRVKRKMELLKLEEKTAEILVRRTDKQRKAYYNYYTGKSWGKPDNYDLCINSSVMPVEQTVRMLEAVAAHRSGTGMPCPEHEEGV